MSWSFCVLMFIVMATLLLVVRPLANAIRLVPYIATLFLYRVRACLHAAGSIDPGFEHHCRVDVDSESVALVDLTTRETQLCIQLKWIKDLERKQTAEVATCVPSQPDSRLDCVYKLAMRIHPEEWRWLLLHWRHPRSDVDYCEVLYFLREAEAARVYRQLKNASSSAEWTD